MKNLRRARSQVRDFSHRYCSSSTASCVESSGQRMTNADPMLNLCQRMLTQGIVDYALLSLYVGLVLGGRLPPPAYSAVGHVKGPLFLGGPFLIRCLPHRRDQPEAMAERQVGQLPICQYRGMPWTGSACAFWASVAIARSRLSSNTDRSLHSCAQPEHGRRRHPRLGRERDLGREVAVRADDLLLERMDPRWDFLQAAAYERVRHIARP